MKKPLLKFAHWMDSLKDQKNSLILLIVLNIFMAIGSNIADWPWVLMVDWYLIPFTPICSLYPLALSVWFILYYYKKNIPAWYTAFIVMGISGYGVMAWIYYPLYMDWFGIHWRLIANIMWVSVYASQALIIASELKKLPWYQYALIAGYFAFKDYSDRFLETFIDIRRPDFPPHLINLFWHTIIILHILALALIIYVPRTQKKLHPSKTLSVPV